MASVKETRMARARTRCSQTPASLPDLRLHFCDGLGEQLPQVALRLT
jgi:hypothetical protein